LGTESDKSVINDKDCQDCKARTLHDGMQDPATAHCAISEVQKFSHNLQTFQTLQSYSVKYKIVSIFYLVIM